MATEPHDVISVGNAMVDILRRCDSATLARFGSTPGAMRLVDHSRQIADMCASLRGGIDVAGGSAANTAVGIASLGGKAAFVGKISEDQFGRTFRHDIRGMGVTFTTPATVLDGKE
ncbi:MAG: PfkB family carbohydrate kinase, partial [Hyphomicrobium sp.]